MTPDVAAPGKSYAFLSNGAGFACEVLDNLLRQQAPPALLVLPEYPPANTPADGQGNLLDPGADRHQRRLWQLAGSLPVDYAPFAGQAACAHRIRQLQIDFLLVACWPYLIGPEMIGSVTKAALNLHPSLLPRYRGADPIGAQLAASERRFGVSLHLLNERYDAGDIVAQQQIADIPAQATRETLQAAAAGPGSRLFIDALNRYDGGWETRRQEQPAHAGDSSAR